MKSITKVKLTVITLTALIIGSYFGISYVKTLFEPKKDLVTQLKTPYLLEELQYDSAFVIPDINDTSDFNLLLDYQPTAAIFNMQSMADSITQEAVKSFTLPIERPLPLLAHWNTGDIGFSEGLSPEYIMTLIENGNHILPSWRINWKSPIDISYYADSIQRAKELNLPLTFIIDPFESTFIEDSSYANMPALENPNVIDKDSNILNKISPFANNELWSEIAQKHATDTILTQIQELYPNPPLVMFVDNKNTPKLSWNEVDTSQRYVARYGNDQTDNFKRTLLGAQWIEKYRLIHEGFKANLITDAWKTNTKFVSYNSISLDIGNSSEWENNSTYTNLYSSVWPQTSDADNLKYHIDGSIDSLNRIIFNANNIPFIRKEAYKTNLDYSLQLSISDSNSFYTGEQYRGFSQLALWLTRPSIIRELNSETYDKDATMTHYQTVMDSVQLIHNETTLQKFWKDGKLVENNNTKIVQESNLPSGYINNKKWFLLDVDVNPSGPWTTSDNIPVYAIALETGITPNREWLVYSQSPEGDLKDISIEIPGYSSNISINSSVLGSFYVLQENSKTIEKYMSIPEAQIKNIETIKELLTYNNPNIPAISVAMSGRQVNTVRTGMTMMVPNKDKQSWDILQVYFKNYGSNTEVVIIDTGSNEIKSVSIDGYAQWHLASSVVAPNGKLYINTLGSNHLNQVINIYDPETNTLTLDAINLPEAMSGETHPMVLGTDNKIYIGGSSRPNGVSYGKAQIVQIDPLTNTAIDFGEMGPSHSPGGVWGYFVCSDDTFSYVSSGKVPWYIVAYNRNTKEQSIAYQGSDIATLYQTEAGCLAQIKDWTQRNFLHNGKLQPADGSSLSPWNAALDKTYTELYYSSTESKFLPEEPIMNTSNKNADSNGDASIWVQKAGTWKEYAYNVEMYPQTISRLQALPNGDIFGTGIAYSGHFTYAPETNSSRYLGKLELSHYATSVHNDKLYMSGYPSSLTYEFDLKNEWTQSEKWTPDTVTTSQERNPRFVGYLNESSGAHKMFDSVVGADGNIYFGGKWYRDGNGGGLSWYDPNTGKQEGIHEIFSNYQIRYMTTLNNNKLIAISTKGVTDIVLGKATPTNGRIFIFDTETKQIINTIDTFTDLISTGAIVGVNDYIVGLATNYYKSATGANIYDTFIYSVDLKGNMRYKIYIPKQSSMIIGDNQDNKTPLAKGPNGYIWTSFKGLLIKINPENGLIHIVGRLEKNINNLLFVKGKLYGAYGSYVAEVKLQ